MNIPLCEVTCSAHRIAVIKYWLADQISIFLISKSGWEIRLSFGACLIGLFLLC